MTSEEIKERFKTEYFSNIHRDGFRELWDFLENSDFFIAPASTIYHGNFEGGLALHSLRVYYEAVRLYNIYKELIPNISQESIAICALMHDLCKANTYKISTRNVKNELTGQWEKVPYYTFDEKFKFGGHGSKSVYLVMKYMKLTDEEAVAINSHMGYSYDEHVGDVYAQNKFAWIIHVADEASSYLLNC